MRHWRGVQQGKSQAVLLGGVAVVLAIGYGALDLYSTTQKSMLATETRGLQMISALTHYKRDNNSYPDSLSKLVPKYAPAVGLCPDGRPIGYQLAGSDYTLFCNDVIYRTKPYRYDSRNGRWSG